MYVEYTTITAAKRFTALYQCIQFMWKKWKQKIIVYTRNTTENIITNNECCAYNCYSDREERYNCEQKKNNQVRREEKMENFRHSQGLNAYDQYSCKANECTQFFSFSPLTTFLNAGFGQNRSKNNTRRKIYVEINLLDL